MQKKLLKLITGTALASSFVLAAPVVDSISNTSFSTTVAQEEESQVDERRTRRTPAMREQAFRRLERAQTLKDEGDVEGAFEELMEMEDMRGLNSYERAMMYNMLAFLYYEQDDYQRAIESYEMVLQQPDLPLGFEDQIRFQLAQFHFVTEDYRTALEYLDEWFRFQESPGVQAYLLKGQAHYALEEYREGIIPIETAIDITRAQGGEPRENWFLLLRGMYYELNDYQAVRDILEYLVLRYEKADYWIQLASIYSELEQEDKQLATMELAYKQGFLTRENHFLNLAQLYLLNQVPWKSAKVMQDGFEQGIIEEKESNFDLYSQALISAKEFEDAIGPLRQAAQLSEDGELYIRLAQILTELQNYDDAVTAINNGIEKGVDREDQAYLVLGNAHYELGNLDQSLQAFRQARRDERSASVARQWIQFIEGERERLRQLRAAGL